jgi:hypothetical protein
VAGHARPAGLRDAGRLVQNLHLARMLCAGQKPGLEARPGVREITPTWMRCTSRRRFVQKLPKTTCGGCFEELTETCFDANSFRGKPFCAGHECWHRQCGDYSRGRIIEPISKQQKFMSNQTTVIPNPNPATPLPAGANASQRPTGDTGGAPKLLTSAASTSTTTNPPAATQAQKPPQQQTVPPASGKVRKPRSGRSH